MSFDPYDVTQQTLPDTISDTTDAEVQQDKSILAQHIGEQGIVVADFSVDMFGGTPLAVGEYTLKATIPDNAIIHEVIIDCTEAVTGSGTLTPSLGADALTAVTSKGVSDDTSALSATPRKTAAEEAITVAVASDTVTAGAFTLYIRYFISG